MKDYKKELQDLIAIVLEEGASDLHISAGRYPTIRITDTLVPLTKKDHITREDALGFAQIMLTDEHFEEFLATKEMDFSFEYKNKARFRGNAYFQKGSVGIGLAKGTDVVQSINKAVFQAKKNLIKVPLVNNTIPKQIQFKYGAVKVLLKPASQGNGVKAGGPVRVIAKLAGIENLTAKLISRTTNKLNIARAVIEALKKLNK